MLAGAPGRDLPSEVLRLLDQRNETRLTRSKHTIYVSEC